MKAKYLIFLCILLLTIGCQNPFGSKDDDKVSITLDEWAGVGGIVGNGTKTCYSDYCVFTLDVLYLVVDGKGNPFAYKKVDFEIVKGDGILSSTLHHYGYYPDIYSDGFTDSNGRIGVGVQKKTSNTFKIKASVRGYNASITTLIEFIDEYPLFLGSTRVVPSTFHK